MLVVSDTTAISNLLQIEAIDLLRKLYGNVVIPKSVEQELLVLETLGFPIKDTLSAPWITVKSVQNQAIHESLAGELDQGEAESIALAIELQADYLLIDEKKGRQVARENELQIIGTLGIIIEARRRGYLSSVRKIMDELREIGFWISEKLYQEVLETEAKL